MVQTKQHTDETTHLYTHTSTSDQYEHHHSDTVHVYEPAPIEPSLIPVDLNFVTNPLYNYIEHDPIVHENHYPSNTHVHIQAHTNLESELESTPQPLHAPISTPKYKVASATAVLIESRVNSAMETVIMSAIDNLVTKKIWKNGRVHVHVHVQFIKLTYSNSLLELE
jgi:hypothetical protein